MYSYTSKKLDTVALYPTSLFNRNLMGKFVWLLQSSKCYNF